MDSVETYVRERTPALLRYALALCGDHATAEDLVQGALARAYRHWGRIGDDPDAYVRRAVLNAHLNRWTRLLRREAVRDVLPETASADRTSDVDDRDALWRALGTLPPRQRAVLVLRYLEGLDERATAACMGTSVGTVKSQASKALASLRTYAETVEVR